MTERRAGDTPLDQVRITAALASRPSRDPDHAAENVALRELIRATAGEPSSAPAALARIALELCGAGSSGLSLIERDERGAEVFRWVALAGRLAGHVGSALPRDWSPCGTCLDEGTAQLYDRPARHFAYLEPTGIVEGLVVPFVGEEAPLGTIWVVTHGDERRFDREDVRVLESLAEVAVTVYERARAQDLAQQALHTHDRFLSIVSHDLRNMLSVVLMNSAMLSRQAASLGAADLLRWAEKTRRSSEQMSRLVGDLLDSAALEAGRLQLSPAPVDPTTLLSEAAASQETVATARRVGVHVAPGSARGALLHADPGRLRQVVDNLLSNALKFTPSGGRVTLDAALDGPRVVISVADEGPGIDTAELPRLFQRFASGDKRGGHGLGLWIARLLVEAHGGRIWVERGAERGSVFRVALPRATA